MLIFFFCRWPVFFFFNDTATTEIYTLSLHDALPIWWPRSACGWARPDSIRRSPPAPRSEEHTSELQSRSDLVCRLLLEKKKQNQRTRPDEEQITTQLIMDAIADACGIERSLQDMSNEKTIERREQCAPFFFFNDTATTEIYTLSLHDALSISSCNSAACCGPCAPPNYPTAHCDSCCGRSEEHTSELQSRSDLVCRLLLEKKKHQHVIPSHRSNHSFAPGPDPP